MATIVSDTFTDTSATILSSHTGGTGATWTQNSALSGTNRRLVISDANRCRQNTDNTTKAYYASGIPSTAEYDITADVVFKSVDGVYVGIAGRMETAADTGYHLRYSGTAWELRKVVAGTTTVLGTWTNTETDESTVAVKLEIRDATKKAFIAGTERISSSDNEITAAGRIGLRASGTGGSDTVGQHIDNLVATDAGSGTAHTQNIDDALGVTDARAFDRGLVVADALGATDSAAFLGAFQRQVDDALGIADQAALVEAFAVSVADALGLTDSQAMAMGLFRTVADTAGISDQATASLGSIRSLADALGITDSALPAIILLQELADSLGLTDALQSQAAFARSIDDPLGLTDAAAPTATLSRAISDALGITDSAAKELTLTVTVGDTLVVTDEQAPAAAYIRNVADALGLADLIVIGGVVIQRGHVAVSDRVARTFVHGTRSANSISADDRDGTRIEVNDG